jgi:hypothetical protein
MVIEFKHIGTSLGTRSMGKEVRAIIEAGIRSGESITLDFNDVKVISNSFADETLAKLLLQFDLALIKQHTTFKNTNSFVQQTIAFALNQRLAQLTH